MTPNLESLSLEYSSKLKELYMPVTCQKLKHLFISRSKLRTFDLGLTPNLETLSLDNCADFVELQVSVACPNLKFLKLYNSRLRSLDLELIPNLESLNLEISEKLVEINAPVGCLKKVVHLNLSGCLRFTNFVFVGRHEPKVNCSSATLYLIGESVNSCRLHPNSNLPKFKFRCTYDENLPSSVGNIEKLLSFGLCACMDFEKFSDMIYSLRCLKKLKLEGDIPEFPKDLGQLECLEKVHLSSTRIKHLPNSICMLKHLKSLKVTNSGLLEMLPEDLGKLECLENLYVVSSKKIEYLPESICMLKRLKCLYVTCCRLGKFPEDIGQLESLETLDLQATAIEHLPDSICMLKHLKYLNLHRCANFVELDVSSACPNLKFLDLYKSRLRSLDLELIPNLERIDLRGCDELLEINAPVGCLKNVGYLNLSGCLRFTQFEFHGRSEPEVSSSADLHLVGESLDLCPLHPNSNLPKLQFRCFYDENIQSSVGNIEKLMSFGLCACTDLKKFSDIICSLQCLKELTLKCDIPEFPKDLGKLECLEGLCLSSTKIKHLPDTICMLIHLKSLKVSEGDHLEKLPEDLGRLECLEKLYVSSKKIEYLSDSICMLKRLKSLDVTHCCCLGKLPEDIGQLASLERLSLLATPIKHLPDNIYMLKHLKFLNLRRCALLEELPEDIGRLECLKELDITDTGISHLPQSIFGLNGLCITASTELLQLYDFP